MWNRRPHFLVIAFLVSVGLAFSAAGTPVAAESGLYFEAGPGLIVYDPPDRDTFPFHEFFFGFPGLFSDLDSPLEFDPKDTGARGYVALGYLFDPSRIPGYLGQGFRVELSSNIYSAGDSDTEYPDAPALAVQAPQRHLVGAYYSNDGMEGIALLGTSLPPPDPSAVSSVHLTSDYHYWDLNVTARTQYPLVKDRLFLAPYFGPMYGNLDQTLKMRARTPSEVVGFTPLGEYKYRVDENLDTDYWGATFGLDLVVKIMDGLTFTLGGSLSPLWADTDMDIRFRGDMLPGGPAIFKTSGNTRVHDSDTEFTFRATGKAELAYRVAWFKASLLGLVEYWDAVPLVEYPEYGSGTGSFVNMPDDVPRIRYDSMTNWTLMFTATFFFGWP
jgi:hypothetical protein